MQEWFDSELFFLNIYIPIELVNKIMAEKSLKIITKLYPKNILYYLLVYSLDVTARNIIRPQKIDLDLSEFRYVMD